MMGCGEPAGPQVKRKPLGGLMKTKLLIAALALCIVRQATADSWGPVKDKEVYSPNKRFRVTVEPERELPAVLCLWESDGSIEKQRFKRRTLNQWSPVRVFVSDGGTVVTLDDWLRAGFEHAVVVYAPSGEVVRDSSLDTVLTADQLNLVPSSKSSRWWRYPGEPVRMHSDWLELTAAWGASIKIDLRTGKLSVGSDHFANLTRLVKSDLTALRRVEHQRWSGAVHVGCRWENNMSTC
jgi:hypothetical protein